MPNYIKFLTQDNEVIYVEIEARDTEPMAHEGELEAALPGQEKITKMVTDAQDTFDDALAIVKRNASAFIRNIQSMSDLPDEVEITFGLKADGALGNLAVAKVGVEASYTVKLGWKQQPQLP
jgi:hypothetical protein